MSRVLKHDQIRSGVGIQPFHSAFQVERAAPSAGHDARESELLALRDECARLNQRLQEAETRMVQLHTQAETAVHEAERRGRDAGMHAADDRSAERLQRLDAGLTQALADFNTAITGLERLAPLLAREGLVGIFGQAETRLELVADIIRHQIATIDANAIVRIEVSATDFANDDALADLASAHGGRRIEIQRLGGLKSGECRIRLALGTLEVGIDQQWGRLSTILLDLALPETTGNG